MTKNIKHGFLFLSLIGLLVYFTGCKKTELEPESTNLVVTIKDDEGNDIPQGDTRVYLFDDSTNFRRAWQDGFYETAISSQLLNGSQTTFTGLDPNKNYWVLVTYNKPVGGQLIPLNNFFTQNTLKNLLESGATTSVVITLTPFQRANIAFYSLLGLNSDDLEIEIFFDGAYVGSITNLRNEPPTSINDANIVKVLYQSDQVAHTYYAVGNNGCVWQGTVEITQGATGFETVGISECGFGHINFWMDNATFDDLGELKVTLNDKDEVGTLENSRNTAPGNCDTDNVLRVTRPTGTYVVSAKPVGGTGCIWVKTVNIVEGCNNVPVEFSACEE